MYNTFQSLNDLNLFIEIMKNSNNTSFKKLKENNLSLLNKKNEEIKFLKDLFLSIDSFLINQSNFKKGSRGFYFNKSKDSKILIGWQFLAILDKRTCNNCKKLNNIIFNKNSKIIKKYIPPLHIGCRCLFSPVTIYENNIIISSDLEIENLKIEINKPFFNGKNHIEVFLNYLNNEKLIKEYSNKNVFTRIFNFFTFKKIQ